MDPDIYLLNQVKKNDVSAFEVLYKKHYKMVYYYARHFLNDSSSCHDIVQNVFTYIWNNRQHLEISKSFKSYILTSCHHACLNDLAKRTNNQRHLAYYFEHTPESEDGYDKIYLEDMKSSLQQAMDELPGQCREIFHLSRIKGLKHKEIAELLQLSPKTIEVQIYRALKVLREKLGYLKMIFF